MRMFMTAAVLLLSAFAACGTVQAQGIGRMRARLAQPQADSAGRFSRVEVHEAGRAAEAVRAADAADKRNTVNGYRVVVFFNNGPSARSEAERIVASFTTSFPDVRCTMRYENPYFKVLAGACTTSEEAVILLGRIRHAFPEAYIMRDEIRVHDLIAPKPVRMPDAASPDEEPSETGFRAF